METVEMFINGLLTLMVLSGLISTTVWFMFEFRKEEK